MESADKSDNDPDAGAEGPAAVEAAAPALEAQKGPDAGADEPAGEKAAAPALEAQN